MLPTLKDTLHRTQGLIICSSDEALKSLESLDDFFSENEKGKTLSIFHIKFFQMTYIIALYLRNIFYINFKQSAKWSKAKMSSIQDVKNLWLCKEYIVSRPWHHSTNSINSKATFHKLKGYISGKNYYIPSSLPIEIKRSQWRDTGKTSAANIFLFSVTNSWSLLSR